MILNEFGQIAYDEWIKLSRNEQSYQTISNYTVNNPAKWNDDKFNTK